MFEVFYERIINLFQYMLSINMIPFCSHWLFGKLTIRLDMCQLLFLFKKLLGVVSDRQYFQTVTTCLGFPLF